MTRTSRAIYAAAAVLVAGGLVALLVYPRPSAEPATQPVAAAPSVSTLTPTSTPTASSTSLPKPATSPKGTPDTSVKKRWYKFEPILLIVTREIDPYWHVDESAALWNRLTGCDLFDIAYADTVSGAERKARRQAYVIREDPNLRYQGQPAHGLFGVDHKMVIGLNPRYGATDNVTVHELGHALGLPHSNDAAGIMNIGRFDLTAPSAAEVDRVRELQPWRCGKGVLR